MQKTISKIFAMIKTTILFLTKCICKVCLITAIISFVCSFYFIYEDIHIIYKGIIIVVAIFVGLIIWGESNSLEEMILIKDMKYVLNANSKNTTLLLLTLKWAAISILIWLAGPKIKLKLSQFPYAKK